MTSGVASAEIALLNTTEALSSYKLNFFIGLLWRVFFFTLLLLEALLSVIDFFTRIGTDRVAERVS